jgi:hypothetical protein
VKPRQRGTPCAHAREGFRAPHRARAWSPATRATPNERAAHMPSRAMAHDRTLARATQRGLMPALVKQRAPATRASPVTAVNRRVAVGS